MFGQDVGAMYEARCAREWEELNKEPEADYETINSELSYAVDGLKDACTALEQARKFAEGVPVEHRINSVQMTVESLQEEITSLMARLKEVKSA